ncbi:anti-sigma factor family protein [Streptomyces sp. NPDC058067]|uniref:anti-sigma factor family protein n=1 Tax=Streptomyces sp. NPDC058067 TaxID=3346324 RepID=UPI0036EF32F1
MRPKEGHPAERAMNCTQVTTTLQAYLDGQTDEVTTRPMAAHLQDCHHCGLEAETYRKIKDALACRTQPDTGAADRLRRFAKGLLRHRTDKTPPHQAPEH